MVLVFYDGTDFEFNGRNKKLAIIATCGYELQRGTDLFEEAIKRGAIHGDLNYIGMLSARDINGIEDFQTEEVINNAKNFAMKIYNSLL